MFFSKIIKHSISPTNIELATIHVRYPRMIHSEHLKHRAMSMNSRSSRAVPTTTLLNEDPYMPIFYKNKRGMQGTELLSEEDQIKATRIWEKMIQACSEGVEELAQLGVHKQHANRPLEWFGYIDVLVTATSWANFFALRTHEAAQPEIQMMANSILNVLSASTPEFVDYGEWHLPYIDKLANGSDRCYYVPGQDILLTLDEAKKISVARCAGISYKPFDGNGSINRELERYEQLVGSSPVHATPSEHQATPDEYIHSKDMRSKIWKNPDKHGPFVGWNQYRKFIANETIHLFEGISST